MDPLRDIVPSSSIRVFLLIENRLLREALVRLFRKRSALLVVCAGARAYLTTCHVSDSKCDVLVIASFQTSWLPTNFPLANVGQPGLKTVLIGMDGDEDQFIAAVRSGVTGY